MGVWEDWRSKGKLASAGSSSPPRSFQPHHCCQGNFECATTTLRTQVAATWCWQRRMEGTHPSAAERTKEEERLFVRYTLLWFFFLAAEKNALRLQRKGCRILCSRRETVARTRMLRVNAHGQLLSSPACKKGKWVDLVGRKGTKQPRERNSRDNPLQRNKCFSTWSKHTNKLGSGGRNWFGARRLFTPLFFFFADMEILLRNKEQTRRELDFREKRSACRSRNRRTEILIAQFRQHGRLGRHKKIFNGCQCLRIVLHCGGSGASVWVAIILHCLALV